MTGNNSGHVQAAVKAIFAAQPKARLSVREIAERVYPEQPITVSETNTINRVLRHFTPSLGLTRVRVAHPGGAWKHVWGKK